MTCSFFHEKKKWMRTCSYACAGTSSRLRASQDQACKPTPNSNLKQLSKCELAWPGLAWPGELSITKVHRRTKTFELTTRMRMALVACLVRKQSSNASYFALWMETTARARWPCPCRTTDPIQPWPLEGMYRHRKHHVSDMGNMATRCHDDKDCKMTTCSTKMIIYAVQPLTSAAWMPAPHSAR